MGAHKSKKAQCERSEKVLVIGVSGINYGVDWPLCKSGFSAESFDLAANGCSELVANNAKCDQAKKKKNSSPGHRSRTKALSRTNCHERMNSSFMKQNH